MKIKIMIVLMAMLISSAMADIKIAALDVPGPVYIDNILSALTGILADDPEIDLIIGPSEGFGGDQSNRGRISIIDSSGYIDYVPWDTSSYSLEVCRALDSVRVLAQAYSVTIAPATCWEVDQNYRCYEVIPIIGPDGHIVRFRRKAHQTHLNPYIDSGIHIDSIVTRDSSEYSYLVTISNESRDIPLLYPSPPYPADIWLMAARHWNYYMDEISDEVQNECPPNWSYVSERFSEEKFIGLLDNGWIKPTAPFVSCCLYFEPGASVAGNLHEDYRPLDDWFVYHDYSITSNGVIVSCDPNYPPRAPSGCVIQAVTTPARVPVESLRVDYGLDGGALDKTGYTDDRGIFEFGVCSPDDYGFVFSYDTFSVIPESSIYYVDLSVPRCTVYVAVYMDTSTLVEEQFEPRDFDLSLYPNPFNSSITISLDFGSESAQSSSTLPPGACRVEIFDINGRIVDNLSVGEGPRAFPLDGNSPNGSAQGRSPTNIIWQPNESLASGVYLVRATVDPSTGSGTETITKRVVYLK